MSNTPNIGLFFFFLFSFCFAYNHFSYWYLFFVCLHISHRFKDPMIEKWHGDFDSSVTESNCFGKCSHFSKNNSSALWTCIYFYCLDLLQFLLLVFLNYILYLSFENYMCLNNVLWSCPSTTMSFQHTFVPLCLSQLHVPIFCYWNLPEFN